MGGPDCERPARRECPEDTDSGGVGGKEVRVTAEKGQGVDRLCVSTEDVARLEWRECGVREGFWRGWGHLVLAYGQAARQVADDRQTSQGIIKRNLLGAVEGADDIITNTMFIVMMGEGHIGTLYESYIPSPRSFQ